MEPSINEESVGRLVKSLKCPAALPLLFLCSRNFWQRLFYWSYSLGGKSNGALVIGGIATINKRLFPFSDSKGIISTQHATRLTETYKYNETGLLLLLLNFHNYHSVIVSFFLYLLDPDFLLIDLLSHNLNFYFLHAPLDKMVNKKVHLYMTPLTPTHSL